jgi:hypothetical protein
VVIARSGSYMFGRRSPPGQKRTQASPLFKRLLNVPNCALSTLSRLLYPETRDTRVLFVAILSPDSNPYIVHLHCKFIHPTVRQIHNHRVQEIDELNRLPDAEDVHFCAIDFAHLLLVTLIH